MGYSVLVRGVPPGISLHKFQIWLKSEVKSFESLSKAIEINALKLSLTNQQESNDIIHKTLQYGFGGVEHNITFEKSTPTVPAKPDAHLSPPILTRDLVTDPPGRPNIHFAVGYSHPAEFQPKNSSQDDTDNSIYSSISVGGQPKSISPACDNSAYTHMSPIQPQNATTCAPETKTEVVELHPPKREGVPNAATNRKLGDFKRFHRRPDLIYSQPNEEKDIKSIPCSYRAASFLKIFDKEAAKELSHVNWDLTHSNGGGITVSGTKKDVAGAETWIRNRVSSYYELEEWSVSNCGFPEFFRAPEYKDFLNKMQDQTNCVVMVNQYTTPQISKITIIENDITKQAADVIVNSTVVNTGNIVDGSVISRFIGAAAGPQLQVECNAIPQASKCTWGVVATKGYNLPCKNIYHAMIDTWNCKNPNTSRSLLKGTISECFKMAATDGHTSIAFPALGCGGFKTPPNVLAELLEEEVNSLGSGTSLQHVYLVLHPKCHDLIKIFKDKLRPSFGNNRPTQGFRYLNVDVCCGSLEEQHVDVIVNSVGTNMDLMSSGLVSWSIVQRGGAVIMQQFNDMKRKYASPTIRVTDGGNLPCDVVIHGATDTLGILSLVVTSLQIAEAMGKSSVAIPALGTGVMGSTPQECAKLIKHGITLFEKQNPVHVKTVKVVVFQMEMLEEFRNNIYSITAPPSRKVPSEQKTFDKEKQTPRANQEQVVTFSFCGLFESNVNNAKMQLQNLIQTEMESNQISDPCIAHLDADFKNSILSVKQAMVKIQVDTRMGMIKVRGITKFVKNATIDIQRILGEFSKATAVKELVQWMYCVQGNNSFQAFELRINMQLENSFKVDNNGILKMPGKDDFFDFSKEKGHIKNSVVEIFRVDKQKSYPRSWRPSKRENWINVDVLEHSDEYREIQSKFLNSGTPIKAVVRLQRIQNRCQYAQFQAKRQEVKTELDARRIMVPPTRVLFHGTSSIMSEKICKEGFNRSFAGKNGILYGQGMYFAANSAYCHDYAKPDDNNIRRMFLAEVATGEYAPEPGNESMITPPVRNPSSKTDSYHSVVDNPKSPEIFVVFKDACAYPHYLLTYI
ncbi:protein mono-ADP-ribosyltransferase PARP14-like [Ciona intestinalis]